jgi:hypothetical protein
LKAMETIQPTYLPFFFTIIHCSWLPLRKTAYDLSW